jgi:hypothetical protein
MSSSLPLYSRSEPTRKILKTQGPVPLGWLHKTAETVKHDLATYQLTELQLWKDSHNLGHEVLLGEFRNRSEVVYIGTERFAMKATSVKNIIKPILRALLQTGKLDAYEPRTVHADDSFWIMPDVQSFRGAIDYIVKSDESHANARYMERGTVKYNLDNMSSAKVPFKPTHARKPHPNIMDFIHAVYATNRTRSYYTPTGCNCFWFTRAILHIFDQRFIPCEKSKVYRRQGTMSLSRFFRSYDGTTAEVGPSDPSK